jgi:hypothetical protein
MGLHEIKKLLHSEEAIHRMGENLSAIHLTRDNQNIQGAQKTKLPKNQ